MSDIKIDLEMKEFIGIVFPRIKSMSDEELCQVNMDAYNDVIDMDLELKECPFCGSFGVDVEMSFRDCYRIRCRDCEACSRTTHTNNMGGIVHDTFEAIDYEIDETVYDFAYNSDSMKATDWQRSYKLFNAYLHLIAIWLSAECWNRRAQ